MPEIKIHNPDALGKPLGQYSQITRVKASEFLFIAGQVATDKAGKTVGADDFDAQCRQVFRQRRSRAEIAGRELRQRRRVHDLSRALPGYPEIHAVSAA